jgi:phosphoribosylanthranilate isomerase
LNVKVIKALRLKDIESIKKISLYKNTWKILIDTHDPQKMGGTGKTLSLDILDSIEDYSDIILAGGLNADNVLSHIDKYSPFGIDASSSIESSPGIKDSSKLIKFVQTVKNRGMYEK